MKIRFGSLAAPVIVLTMVVLLADCGGNDDGPTKPPPPTVLKVIVKSDVDSSLVENANVVLYLAESREAVLRNLTDAEGAVYFRCDEGDYYLNVAAQGFKPVPQEDIAPIPFFVAAEDTTIQERYAEVLSDAGSTGYILGSVEPVVDNFLILAEADSSQDAFSTVSGPDGFFVLFNVPYATYSVSALKSGFNMVEGPAAATLSSEAEIDTVQIAISQYEGSVLRGMVSFLASDNSIVDITLLDSGTRSVVPGLTVMSGVSSLDYEIDHIPDGNFLAWASLANDGYVIDPDWVFKNPGGLDVSFTTADTVQLNFSVTDAITILSPTNPADSTYAAMADSSVPTFRWVPYPSAKEYFIEVRDLDGRRIWGGFEPDGTVNHGFIGASVSSVEYGFDNPPGLPALQPGKIYQWQIWADIGTHQDSFVEQLISSSEDLLGIFQVPGGPEQ